MILLLAWILFGGRPPASPPGDAPADPVPGEAPAPELPAGELPGIPSAPVCAVTPDGAILLAWESQAAEGAGRDILFNRRGPGREGRWMREPLRLDPDAAGTARSLEPRIAAAGEAVYVAWQDARDGADDIRFTRSTDGGRSWSAVDLRVDDDVPGAAVSSMPALAADGSGRVYLAWEDLRHGDRDILFARSTDGGRSFGPNVRLDADDPGSGVSYHPQLLSGEAGALLAFWRDERDGLADVLVRRSSDAGATWGPERRLDPGAPGATASRHLSVASEGGRVAAAWEEEGAGVLARTSPDFGETWTPVGAVAAAGGSGELRDPRVLAGAGRWLVGAVEPGGGLRVLELAGRDVTGEVCRDRAAGEPRWLGAAGGRVWTALWSPEEGLWMESGETIGFLTRPGRPVSGAVGAATQDGGAFLAWIGGPADRPRLEAGRLDGAGPARSGDQ
jgi:hypothetical protein